MTNFRPMSGTTKWWIRWTRYLQLGLRSLELVAGLGLLTLMILITNVEPVALAWVMRIVVRACNHRARPPNQLPFFLPLSTIV